MNTDVILVTENGLEQAKLFAASHALKAMSLISSGSLVETFGIHSTPYAVAIDEHGIVRGKGLVNQIEHLDSLLNSIDVRILSSTTNAESVNSASTRPT